MQENLFLYSGNLLEFLVLVPKSGVPPCESSRPEDSENVVVFGCGTFQIDFEILDPLQKIKSITKKSHGHNFDQNCGRDFFW